MGEEAISGDVLGDAHTGGRFEDEDARLVWAADEMGGEVVIERHLGTLFHKIHWPIISAVDLEALLLRNLVGDIRIRVILDARTSESGPRPIDD